MNRLSLRIWVPVLLVLALLMVGAASVALTLHRHQQLLTQESRDAMLADVARLSRLADQTWPLTQTFVTADIAQISSKPVVQAVFLLDDRGRILAAHRMGWVGRQVSEVWPSLEADRMSRVAKGRLPDWRISDDQNALDALLGFDLPSGQTEVRSSRRGVVYVAYDLSVSRQQTQYAEIMARMPDLVALIAVLGILIWVMGVHVTGPLKRLDEAASALRSGKMDVHIPQEGFEEISLLGEGFAALRQELEATWRAMPDLLFELSQDGRYLRVLSSRPELLVSTPDQLLGRFVHDVMPPDAVAIVMRAINDAKNQGGVWGRELMLQVPAGQLWFEISVARKDSSAGAQPTFLLISRDITARKLSEEGLRQLNETLESHVAERTAELLTAKNDAERANQSKSEFLSRMSHELRTPLNAILGFGQLLDIHVKDASLNGYVRQIIDGGKHLLSLINEVLDLARVESGQMTVSLEQVPLAPLLGECLAMVLPHAEANQVKVLPLQCADDMQVIADRVRLKQVLLNLLSNAIKYNHKGGSVCVSCQEDGEHLVVRVTDSGSGLSESDQQRLFVPFERLDADERRIEGTGIGLALSQRLMLLMEGQIGVESQSGQGATFWIRLQKANEAAPTLAEVKDVVSEVDSSLVDSGALRKVLCIEDNPTNLQLIESVVKMLPGVKLISAMTPVQGLEMAQTQSPDLILLDINLPDMDGYAVMQCLRESPVTCKIPVIAVSANAMAQDLARGRAAGFVDYVTKPIDVARLVRLVDEWTSVEPV